MGGLAALAADGIRNLVEVDLLDRDGDDQVTVFVKLLRGAGGAVGLLASLGASTLGVLLRT